MITLDIIKRESAIKTYIGRADNTLEALGFTEHCFSHAERVSSVAGEILKKLGYPAREIELAQIAGYIHDIGNLVNRDDHAQSGAVMAFRLLDRMGMDPDEIATIVTAIGHHDEKTAVPVNPVAAALILADKCDVRRSRVRNSDPRSFDIHDRVNYSVTGSKVKIYPEDRQICLMLTTDAKSFSMIEYFEIFMDRMLLCRRAAEKLDTQFLTFFNDMLLA